MLPTKRALTMVLFALVFGVLLSYVIVPFLGRRDSPAYATTDASSQQLRQTPAKHLCPRLSASTANTNVNMSSHFMTVLQPLVDAIPDAPPPGPSVLPSPPFAEKPDPVDVLSTAGVCPLEVQVRQGARRPCLSYLDASQGGRYHLEAPHGPCWLPFGCWVVSVFEHPAAFDRCLRHSHIALMGDSNARSIAAAVIARLKVHQRPFQRISFDPQKQQFCNHTSAVGRVCREGHVSEVLGLQPQEMSYQQPARWSDEWYWSEGGPYEARVSRIPGLYEDDPFIHAVGSKRSTLGFIAHDVMGKTMPEPDVLVFEMGLHGINFLEGDVVHNPRLNHPPEGRLLSTILGEAFDTLANKSAAYILLSSVNSELQPPQHRAITSNERIHRRNGVMRAVAASRKASHQLLDAMQLSLGSFPMHSDGVHLHRSGELFYRAVSDILVGVVCALKPDTSNQAR